MSTHFLLGFLSLLVFTTDTGKTSRAIAASEQICGKWENEEKTLVVQVYKAENEFRAKIVWFNDGGGKKMDEWTDKNNPDPALRSRKILGMNVLEKLVYSPKSNSWEEGMIYDAKNGRHWNSSAYINEEGVLKVKGYWHFKFIGKTINFKRM